MPALKYIHHVHLFKSHYFGFHFLACVPWDPVARSLGPISFFSFSSTISFQKHSKGQLHRLAVVEGGGLAVECDWGEDWLPHWAVGWRGWPAAGGRVPPSSLPFSRPAPDPSPPLLSTNTSEKGSGGVAPQQGPGCAHTGSSSSSMSVLHTDSR